MKHTGRRRRLLFSKIYSFRRGKIPLDDDHSQIGGPGFSRVVYCNEPGGFEASIRNYVSNYVRSTKYTAASFLPKALFEQFRRVANFYFLVIGVLAFTPLAPYSAVSAILPLAVVVGATMIKEGIEDWERKKQVFLSVICFPVFTLRIKFCVIISKMGFSESFTIRIKQFFSTFLVKRTPFLGKYWQKLFLCP